MGDRSGWLQIDMGPWVGGFQVGVGGFSSAWAVCGHGADMAKTRYAASRILQCHPTEEEESLADDGKEEEMRWT